MHLKKLFYEKAGFEPAFFMSKDGRYTTRSQGRWCGFMSMHGGVAFECLNQI